MVSLNLSYFHRGGTIPLLGDTIPQYFLKVVEAFPDHEALVSIPQNRRLTYSEFSQQIDQLAKALMANGYSKGDRVGIWSTNNIEWVLIQMATARIGVILVNINPAYRTSELSYALKRSEVQGLFVIPSFKTSIYLSMLLDIVPELHNTQQADLNNKDFPALRQVIVFDPKNPLNTQCEFKGFRLWQDFLKQTNNITDTTLIAVSNTLDRDDPINIQYTSGTTGFPKAVLLSHHNILNNAYFSAHAMHFTASDRLCIPVPFYHCFGMVLANLLCFSVGACAVISAEYFDAEKQLIAIEKEKCTAIHGVPTMFIAQLEHPRFREFNLSSLRTGIMAGAPCAPALMQRVIEDMHCKEILIGYGETEASPLTHLTTREDNLQRRTETVGKNLSHQEVKIVNTDSGYTVPIGEIGEICFRGYHIMHGYYNDVEATKKAIDGSGWLHSGDLGVMDTDGYVKITGRLKDMIIRGGENIYPREIEDYLFTHPKVAEVAVFGVPDEYYGEEVMAWIQTHKPNSMNEEEIREFCQGYLAHFKIPKYIWFVNEFPMTITGKLQKYKMREMAVEKMDHVV